MLLLQCFIVLVTSLLGRVEGAIVPANSTGNASWPYQTYKTVDFTPPWLAISAATSASEGYLFFAPDGTTEFELAPLIFDVNGELVWNGPKQHAFNFGVQQYKNETVLVAWNGTLYAEPIGRGNGAVVLWNKYYEQIAQVTLPGNFLEQVPGALFPSNIDVHEVYITPHGSMLVTANNVTTADLTPVGGPVDGWVVEAQFYEIDIATNEVLFCWKSLDHLDQIPFAASLYPLGSDGLDGTSQPKAWGYFHINAVSPYDDGFLISSRFLCSALAVTRATGGRVAWRLQGRDGSGFALGPGASFCFQHDLRAVPPYPVRGHVTLHMHDNANSPIENGSVPSSGKILDVDLVAKRATLVARFWNASGPVYSTAQGNLQPLPDGSVFVGHGWIPVMEEFSPAGQIRSTVQFGAAEARPGGGFLSAAAPTLSYRAFKQPWVGCPVSSAPAVVAESVGTGDGPIGTTVYVSWNGATEVVAWSVYGGMERPSYITTVEKTGFETVINIPVAEFVQVKPVFKTGAMANCGQNISSELVFVSRT